MKKKEIRYQFVSNFSHGYTFSRYLKAFSPKIEEKFDFIETEDEPDYVIANEHIYLFLKCHKRFSELLSRHDKSVFIYFAGECISPDLNIFDYSFSFDRNLTYNDRVIRIPATVFFQKENELKECNTRDELAKIKKDKFCNFIYSNGKGHQMRKLLFEKISSYKQVDSLGKFLNNTTITNPEAHENWESESINLKSRYKFSIAAENATFCGYTSEKIMTSFLAHTVPIYWGDPTIEEEFNGNAFINCHRFKSMGEVLQEIKRLDTDHEAYLNVLCEPPQTQAQKELTTRQKQECINAWINIFDQESKQAKRIGLGFHPENYRDFYRENLFFKGFYGEKPSIQKMLRYALSSVLFPGKQRAKYRTKLIEQLYYMGLCDNEKK